MWKLLLMKHRWGLAWLIWNTTEEEKRLAISNLRTLLLVEYYSPNLSSSSSSLRSSSVPSFRSSSSSFQVSAASPLQVSAAPLQVSAAPPSRSQQLLPSKSQQLLLPNCSSFLDHRHRKISILLEQSGHDQQHT